MASRRGKTQPKPAHPLRYRAGDRGDHTERNRRIYEKRAAGLTLEQIGIEENLSGTAVGYILRAKERKDERAKRLAKSLSPLKAAFARGLRG